jgi:ribonuclease HI
VNVDAAIFSSSRQMGAGIVARDHTGSYLVACGERSDDVMMPELAEALAIRRAVFFAREEGFSKIIVASDCLSVIQRIKSSMTDRSEYGPVIEDIKFSSKLFVSLEFRHVLRVLNVAAHNLAGRCVSSVNYVWRGAPPVCIREALCNDLLIMDQ